ncbi:T9SS type A sorting domain-containing protein [Candidatus Eisenbacteria bacterium]|uniref:T9SS type A sorting domain-containing protein n=1 Tax=Eiseniibacteriota bacterium TaxID=2212470 RepID=A0ABV6YN67_UNCEI
MRSRGPVAVAVLSIMAITFMVGISSLAFAGNNPSAKVAVHVRPHNAKLACNVTIAGCEDIVTTEPSFSFDAFPVFYNLTEYLGVQYGLSWPAWAYSAAFTSCSDLVIGAVDLPGSGAAHTWTSCQSGVAVPSFVWIYADAPGTVCPIEYPDSDPPLLAVLDCAENLDEPCGIFCAGVYGAVGDNPCDPCDITFDPLVIEKYDNANVCVDPTETFIYTIRYTNPNTSVVNNVVLTDTLDSDVNFQSATGGGTLSAGVVTWSFATLDPGAVDSVDVVVEVDATADYETILVNGVGIVSDETDPANIRHTTDVCEYEFADLGLVKSDDVETCAFPGDQVVYNLVYENSNLFAVDDVAIVDNLPNNVNHISSTGGTYDEGTHSVAWDLGTVSSYAVDSVQITVEMKVDAPQGSFVNNTCSITGLQTGTTNTNLLTPVCACLISGPIEACPEATDQFTGPADIASWTWNITGDGTISGSNTEQTVSVVADATCPGSYELELVAEDGDFSSTCYHTVTVDDNIPPVIDTCPADMTVECASEIPEPDIGLVSGTDNCGGTLTVTYLGHESNGETCPEEMFRVYELADACGNADTCLQYITVNDTTPPVIVTCPANETISCGDAINFGTPTADDNCDGAITPTIILDESVAGPGAGEITHTRGWEMADACGNADSCYQEILEEACTYVPLTLSKDDDIAGCVEREANITYTISYENTNGLEVTNVTLSDEMPAGVSYVSSSPAGTPSGSTVDWDLGTLGAGATGSVELVVQVDAGTTPGITLTNQSMITSDETGSTNANVGTEVCSPVYDPLVLSKVDDIADCVEREGNITYTINYANTNDDGVTGVILSDTMPPNVDYVSSNPAGSEDAGVVTWDIGSVVGQGGGSVELVVQVQAGTTPGITLTNNCEIDCDQIEPTATSATTEVCATTFSPLNLAKEDGISVCVDPEDYITYTIDYENPNSDPVTGVVLSDTLPGDLMYLSSTGGGSESGGVVTWNLNTLGAGVTGSVDLEVQVSAGATPGGTVANNAVIVSNETGNTYANEVTNVCAATVFDPMGLQKTVATGDCVGDGAIFTYTITYDNPNDDPLTGVVLTDNLPAELEYVSSTGGGSYSMGVVTWNLGTVANGQSSVELVVEVTPSITPGGTILNTCAINSNETGETQADRSVPVCDCHIEGTQTVCPNSTTIYGTNGGADSYAWFITGNGTIPGDRGSANVDVVAGPDCGVPFTLQVDREYNGGWTTCYYTVDVEDNMDPVITCPADERVACGDPIVFGTATATDNCKDPISAVEVATVISQGPGPGEYTHERFWEAVDDCGNVSECSQAIVEEACGSLVIAKSDNIADRPGGCVDPGGEIVYTLYAENPNTVDIPDVVVIDDLPAGVDFVSANQGGSYDGGMHRVTWNLGTLLGDEGRVLELVVLVPGGTMPGINLVNNASIGSDNTVPASDDLTTAVCGTGVMPLDVDIKPTSCPNPYNTKSMGKIPVAILGTDYLDVYDINPATVMLEGVPILKYSYEDVATPVVDGEPCECNEAGYDGYMDLVVHFNRPALTAALGPVDDGDVLALILMAAKYDGTALQGSDCVWILHKPSNGQAPDVAVVPDPEETHILLTTGEAAEITLVIYDVHGRAVAGLLDEYKAAGSYDVIWNGTSNGVRVPAGVYFATASNSDGSTTKKFVVVR